MYPFILNMWIMQKIDAEKVQSYEPKFITQEEVDMILATPQGDKYDVQSIPSQKMWVYVKSILCRRTIHINKRSRLLSRIIKILQSLD